MKRKSLYSPFLKRGKGKKVSKMNFLLDFGTIS